MNERDERDEMRDAANGGEYVEQKRLGRIISQVYTLANAVIITGYACGFNDGGARRER